MVYMFISSLTTTLHHPFHLGGDQWYIALADFSFNSKNSISQIESLNICCNLCEESIVNGQQLNILRRVYVQPRNKATKRYSSDFNTLYYIPLNTKADVKYIHITVTDSLGEDISIKDCELTLHLTQHGQ